MEKVKSVERAAIIKSRPNNEQKAAANGGTTQLNSDGTPPLRLRPSQLYHQPQLAATGPPDRKTTAHPQQHQDRVENVDNNDEDSEDDEQENQYFYEDEIFCLTPKNGHVKFGLVLDNYDESEEETAEDDAPKRGEIRACWHPDGREEIIKQRKVGLADRTLMPGDVVRRMVPGRDTQRGYCHEIKVRADLRIVGTKYVVRNVASDRLRPLLSMPKDSAVCLDSWVGSTKQINEKLVLKSSCGSLVEICPASELGMFRDHSMRFRRGFFAEPLFYPGQQLVGLMSELANGKWLTTSNEMKLSRKNYMLERKFTVQSVELQGVSVHWQCKVSVEDVEQKLAEGVGLQQPPEYITGEDLKRLKKLNLFEPCMLQINDKNYLRLEEADIICTKQSWRKDMSSKYREQLVREGKGKDRATSKPPVGEAGKKGKASKCGNGSSKLSVKKADNLAAKLTDSDEGWETDEEGELSDGAASSCSATSKTSPKKSPLLSKRVRKLKRRQLLGVEFGTDRFPAAGDEVITEALVVYSTATVVWQDGTIEPNIPSTELRPIHHLDDHEFFPGDFVLAGNTDPAKNPSFRDYGVIQDVDHHGRTARVKWFSTYTCTSEPQPTYNGETEVSVYDLKDHPDFQYRPGTIVIRVANFTGAEEGGLSTAGQVLDNYPNGMVQVWWVDGFVSLCWPQDIFEVGQYDSENNFWGSVGDSDAESWETEAESCHFGDADPASPSVVLKPQLTVNLERARVAIARLEELFNINPHLQNQEIMKKLMLVYKKCRFLDRLMNTSFFHERHFMGLVERVRKSNNQTTVERMQDQKNRLFNQSASGSKTSTPTADTPVEAQKSSLLLQQRALFSPGTPNGGSQAPPVTSPAVEKPEEDDKANYNVGIANMELDYVNNMCMKMNEDADVDLNNTSSVFDLAGGAPESDKPDQEEDKETGEQLARECVSARLCSLIKGQLIKVLEEINERYGLEDPFKEIISVVELKTPTLASMPPSWTPSPAGTPDIPGTNTMASNPLATSSPAVIADAMVPSSPSAGVIAPECFQIIESAPTSHKYHLTIFQTSNAQSFYKAVQREHWMLRSGLPPGVWVRTFEDRLDLLSVMIEGPKKTPYEDGLFLFDIQLGLDYPRTPPLCHYISYCTDRLNPNLYEDGKVCVSLLGTWSGRGTEVWGPSSTLLQVIVSIQGLILVSEPYFNEAGYEKLRGSQQGKENSRMYNEMVLLKLVQSMTKLVSNPPEVFREQILSHFHACGQRMYRRLRAWMELSSGYNRKASVSEKKEHESTDTGTSETTGPATSTLSVNREDGAENKCESVIPAISSECLISQPEFPLIPASRGFCLTLTGLLESFQNQLQQLAPLPHADGK
uniref:UBC core domain-containing protein n=1 Tax=Anopheles farauti TaxID=69004 RepID=A0A182Q3T4_9DIPT